MFSNKANKLWPGTEWHGESSIHVSVCWNAVIPMNNDHKAEIMALLEKYDFGGKVYRYLSKKFDGLVWLLSPEEFSQVFLADCYNHLRGKGDTRSPNKITNPSTGNKFHQVAVINDIVCGIRFWCDGYGGDETLLGWRFRITTQDEAEEDTRRRNREEVAEAQEVMVEVMDLIHEAELKEAPAHVEAKVTEMLMTLAMD